MDAAELRAMQAPIKERYKSDAKAAMITLRAKGIASTNRTSPARSKRAARWRSQAAPGDRRLGHGAVLGRHAARGAGRLRRRDAEGGAQPRSASISRPAHVSAEGDLDFRGTLGVDKEAPVGLRPDPSHSSTSDTDEPQEKLDQLLKLTERYCVVYQTIKSGPPVAVTMTRV